MIKMHKTVFHFHRTKIIKNKILIMQYFTHVGYCFNQYHTKHLILRNRNRFHYPLFRFDGPLLDFFFSSIFLVELFGFCDWQHAIFSSNIEKSNGFTMLNSSFVTSCCHYFSSFSLRSFRQLWWNVSTLFISVLINRMLILSISDVSTT